MSVEKTVHARSGWPMLALMLVVTAVCVALIVAGATMLPLDEAPVTTGTQALGVAFWRSASSPCASCRFCC